VQESKAVHKEVDEVTQMVKILLDEKDKASVGKILPTTEPSPTGEKNARMEPSKMSQKHGNVSIALGKLTSDLDEIFHSDGNLEIGHQESAL